MSDRKLAAPPQINPETKPFWDAAAQGRLLVKKCQACGQSHHYPRALCPFCFSDQSIASLPSVRSTHVRARVAASTNRATSANSCSGRSAQTSS